MKGLKILIFSVIILLSFSAYTQTNYLSGYYITLNNDTVHGFIEHLSERKNSQNCFYKATLSSKPVSFSADKIKGFAILDQDFYESNTFQGKRSAQPIMGFFRVLVKGRLTLLTMHERYFIKTDSGKIIDISKYSREDKSKLNSKGIGMLKVLTKNCESDISVEQLYKRETPLFVQFVRNYNISCSTGSTFEAKNIKRKPHIDLGVQIGLLYSGINFQNDLRNFNPEIDASFAFGGYTSVFIPRISENVRFLLEISGGSYNQYTFLAEQSTNNDLLIRYSFLRPTILIRYSYKHFFIDAGYQVRYVFDQKSTWRVESIEGNYVFTQSKPVEPFQSVNGSYLVGLGAQFKLFNIPVQSSLRFTKSKTLAQAYQPVFQTFELVVSAQLTK